jgi:hypothetical protein
MSCAKLVCVCVCVCLCTGKIDADELRHIFVTLGDALTQVRVCTKNFKKIKKFFNIWGKR